MEEKVLTAMLTEQARSIKDLPAAIVNAGPSARARVEAPSEDANRSPDGRRTCPHRKMMWPACGNSFPLNKYWPDLG
jgi:hypothetical protein